MSRDRIPPHDLGAEESVLGAMVLSAWASDLVFDLGLDAGVFYKPAHQHMYAAMRAVRQSGKRIDAVSLAAELRHVGLLDEVGGPAVILGLQNATPSVSNVLRYAKIVQDAATRRSMIAAAAQITDIAYEGPAEVAQALEEAEAQLRNISYGGIDRWPVYEHPDAIPAQRRDDWVLQQLLLPGEVMIATAGGGGGKSTLLRQLAMCSVNGLHPFTGEVAPGPLGDALIFDTETQSHGVKESLINIGNKIRKNHGFEPEFPKVVTLRERLDLRGGQDLAELRRIIARIRPRLVCLGPLKNLFIERDGESYSNAALDMQDRLMGIMVDFDCAMAIEAHGTKADVGTTAGSQRWNDWPDIAFGMEPLTLADVEQSLQRQRGAREKLTRYEDWVYTGNGAHGDALIRITPRRQNRNDLARVPDALVRTPNQMLPWMSIPTSGYSPPPSPGQFRPNPGPPQPHQQRIDEEPF